MKTTDCRDLIRLAVLSVLCLATITSGQNMCARCTDTKFSSIPSTLQTIFSATVLPTSPICSSARFGQSGEGLSFVACPAVSQDGRPQRCVAYRGTLSLTFNLIVTDVEFPIDLVYRDCLPIDAAIPSNCQNHNSIPTDNSLFSDTLSSLVGQTEAVTFSGTRCVSGGSSDPNSASRISKGSLLSMCILTLIALFI